MEILKFGNEEANILLIQPVDDHDLNVIRSEIETIRSQTGKDFYLLSCKVDNWNRDLSPWKAAPVFGTEPFGGKAQQTLDFLQNEVLSRYTDKTLYIGGYSLAGLFALWAVYQTDIFQGAAAASPSVWFPGFLNYTHERQIQTKAVYLSLGDREEKTKNPLMSQVGNAIRALYEDLDTKETVRTTLEWNSGNHFKDPDLRTAKAFAWLLEEIE